MTTKLIWHSNAPWTPTGYGQQTALFALRLAEKYDVAVSAFYGLEGAPIRWEGLPIFPGLGGDFGNPTLPMHAERFFGDRRDGLVVTLCDVWPLEVEMARSLNMACWVPIDHEPAPQQVTEFLLNSEVVPIAMTRFGQRMLEPLGLDPLYWPHGVDTHVYRPRDKEKVRREAFPRDAFVVGMVGANKGAPSRKAFSQALLAYSKFMQDKPNTFLYLHTCLDANIGQGVNIPALIRALELPMDRIRIADQYQMLHNPYTDDGMAQIYSALDVLLNPSFGEGFGITPLEAQACGVPAIVTDWTAMPEVCGAGWHVKHHPYWTGLSSWQATPDIDDIILALEECYALKKSEREKLSVKARKHALTYDVRRVADEFMFPAIAEAERRLESRRPVAIPERRKWSVAVVTPWRDHDEFTEDYRAAVTAAKPDELIIIDDGSQAPIDGAMFRFEEPVGYTRASNKGLELATADVVVLLNNDIKMTDEHWLDRLVALCEPGVLVGQLRRHRLTLIDGRMEPYIDGWCLAAMREDLERLGGLDESFHEPAYYCDNDLCLRAQQDGMRLVDTRVGLAHKSNGTTNDDVEGRERAAEANHALYSRRVRESRVAAA